MTASQISHGRENDLWIEVDGTKGALEWHQEEPNKLIVREERRAAQDLHARRRPVPRAGARGAACRLPSGHPEAFFEAFANIYTAAYDDMVKRASGEKFETANTIYPNVDDGVDGMNFITQCVASQQAERRLAAVPPPEEPEVNTGSQAEPTNESETKQAHGRRVRGLVAQCYHRWIQLDPEDDRPMRRCHWIAATVLLLAGLVFGLIFTSINRLREAAARARNAKATSSS